jgi:hypothetical protein
MNDSNNSLRECVLQFLQDIKNIIISQKEMMVRHITDTHAHEISSAESAENVIDENRYSDTTLLDTLTDSTNKLLESLISTCDDPYVHPTKHSADIIETNSSRRFISDAQISEFSNKAGELYVDDKISEMHKIINRETSNKLINIINMPNVTNNLEAINAILNSQETLLNLISLCSEKISKEEFESHEGNNTHLTDEAINNLKLLKSFIENGGVDWNSDIEDEINAIKNKPTSLPANGGNADTVANRDINALLNGRKRSTAIIGKRGFGYTKDMCDYWCDGTNDAEVILQAISDISSSVGGEIYIREGIYNIKQEINIKRDTDIRSSIIIMGCGNATILNFNDNVLHLNNNIEVNRLYINEGAILIDESVEFNDCRLEKCSLRLINTMSSITNCDIVSSNITYGENSINNMITNNRIASTTMPTFAGDNFVKCNFRI